MPTPIARRARMLKNVLRLLRYKQWSKNLLVFAAGMFAGKAGDPSATGKVLLAFVAMCLASSAVYVVNDVLDADRDRNHPKKRERPVASGAISVPVALAIAAVFLVGALGASALLTPTCLLLVVSYLALQVAYNVRLKAVPVLDVYAIATGFVIRAVLGASALVIGISGWFLFCTGALALMLGFAKRRNEFMMQGDGMGSSRESLVHYSQQALDALVVVFASTAALCYGIYTLDSETARQHSALILTAPFVFYAITRYVLLVFRENEGGEPADLLFGDWHIVGSVLLFVLTAALAISGLKLPFLER